MKSLTWNQVNGWRLAQHGLAPRLAEPALLDMTSRLYGIHAQIMSAAELALGARMEGLRPQDVQQALWQDRSIVKTWAMRGTLHLLTAEDLALHAAARTIDPLGWIDFDAHGISEQQARSFLEAVPEVLGSEAMTRQELADAVTERLGLPALGNLIASSKWGTALKLFAFRGELCFGPNRGQNVTFVNAKNWLGKWEPVEPEFAFQEIARRYFRAYGPLTPKVFARWWNEGRVNVAKRVFKQIEDELEPVDVEGWQALALRSTLEPMQQASVSGVVRLLPMFDAYTLDVGRIGEPILPRQHWKQVFRPQGWTTAVVLVDGYIKGVWSYATQKAQTKFSVEMFEPPTKLLQRGIEAEAARWGAFLDSAIDLEYAPIK